MSTTTVKTPIDPTTVTLIGDTGRHVLYAVPSQSGHDPYTVRLDVSGGAAFCPCPAYYYEGVAWCKHCAAATYKHLRALPLHDLARMDIGYQTRISLGDTLCRWEMARWEIVVDCWQEAKFGVSDAA